MVNANENWLLCEKHSAFPPMKMWCKKGWQCWCFEVLERGIFCVVILLREKKKKKQRKKNYNQLMLNIKTISFRKQYVLGGYLIYFFSIYFQRPLYGRGKNHFRMMDHYWISVCEHFYSISIKNIKRNDMTCVEW